MPIYLGRAGTVKTVSTPYIGRASTVRTVSRGYNGAYGAVRQFFGNPTGINYFVALPSQISVGIVNSLTSYAQSSNQTFVSATPSSGYKLYTYRSPTNGGCYVQTVYYQNTSTSYPRSYLADYVTYTIVSTGSTSSARGFTCRNIIGAFYDGETLMFTQTDGSYYADRTAWLNYYAAGQRYPTTYSVTGSIYVYSSSGTWRYYSPALYSDSVTYSSFTNGETKTLTSNQDSLTSNSYSCFFCGALIESDQTANVILTQKFPTQTITFAGSTYPIYFSFESLPHS